MANSALKILLLTGVVFTTGVSVASAQTAVFGPTTSTTVIGPTPAAVFGPTPSTTVIGPSVPATSSTVIGPTPTAVFGPTPAPGSAVFGPAPVVTPAPVLTTGLPTFGPTTTTSTAPTTATPYAQTEAQLLQRISTSQVTEKDELAKRLNDLSVASSVASASSSLAASSASSSATGSTTSASLAKTVAQNVLDAKGVCKVVPVNKGIACVPWDTVISFVDGKEVYTQLTNPIDIFKNAGIDSSQWSKLSGGAITSSGTYAYNGYSTYGDMIAATGPKPGPGSTSGTSVIPTAAENPVLNSAVMGYKAAYEGLQYSQKMVPLYQQALANCPPDALGCIGVNQSNLNTVSSSVPYYSNLMTKYQGDIATAGGDVSSLTAAAKALVDNKNSTSTGTTATASTTGGSGAVFGPSTPTVASSVTPSTDSVGFVVGPTGTSTAVFGPSTPATSTTAVNGGGFVVGPTAPATSTAVFGPSSPATSTAANGGGFVVGPSVPATSTAVFGPVASVADTPVFGPK